MNEIRNLLDNVEGLKHAQFASLTYKTKSDESVSRYTVILGFSYKNLLDKALTELEILRSTLTSELEIIAWGEVLASIQKSIAAHAAGTQSEDYTKKDQYIPVCNGLSINKNDGSAQLFGLIHSKVELVAGKDRKPVKSAPLTIAKNKIRRELSISKFREFAIDPGNVVGGKINGNTFEMA